jgi:RNA polymerase sigma factor (sigma-70 family)
LETAEVHIHQELIDRCKTGDQKAQLRIYELYYKAMYNTSYRILRDEMAAEDTMQDAFLEAFKSIGKIRESITFGSWLKRIVVNKSINELHKKKVATVWIDEVMPNYETKDETTTESAPDISEITTAIEGLADGYRVILSLYLLEGYDHEEIAEILKITSSTSRSQYTRAKSKLKQILQQTNYA